MTPARQQIAPILRLRWRKAFYMLFGGIGLLYFCIGSMNAIFLSSPEIAFKLSGVSLQQTIAPWRPWSYVAYATQPANNTQTNDSEQGTPVFSNQDVPAHLERNDLFQRVQKLQGNLKADAEGIERKGIVSVPLRQLANWTKSEMQWDGVGPAVIYGSLGRLLLQNGKSTAQLGFEQIKLSDAPFIENNEFYIPLRVASQLLKTSLIKDPAKPVYTLTRKKEKFRVVVPNDSWKIEIDRSERWLRVFYGGALAKHYSACTGEGNNTPIGEWQIVNKAVAPGWRAYWGEYIPGGSPRNPLGVRWLGTSAHGHATGRVIGIHGTNQPSSIGTRISGGCIRLQNVHAIELYEVIPIGTRVSIHE